MSVLPPCSACGEKDTGCRRILFSATNTPGSRGRDAHYCPTCYDGVIEALNARRFKNERDVETGRHIDEFGKRKTELVKLAAREAEWARYEAERAISGSPLEKLQKEKEPKHPFDFSTFLTSLAPKPPRWRYMRGK